MAQQRLFAFITENPLSHNHLFSGGKYNGYVGIIEDTTNVVDYTDPRLFDTDYYINVHGGVTFDGTKICTLFQIYKFFLQLFFQN